MSDLLNNHLGQYYHAASKNKSVEPILTRMKETMNNPDYRSAVERKLAELNALDGMTAGALSQRCAVSHSQLKCLKEVVK